MIKFELAFDVRDYECDLQGIVNNAVYQNYFEHTRHQHLKAVGLDFAELHSHNIDPVVYRIEIDFKRSLKSGDQFKSVSEISREGNLKIIFNQAIYKEEELITKAKVVVFFTSKGKAIAPPQNIIDKMFK
jgi:acyl-CoA thioester hydrolase